MQNNLENRLEQSALGERRFNPDEQRKFLSTFRERVILLITFDDSKKEEVLSAFDNILSDVQEHYSDVYVKINGNLPDNLLMKYTKIAQDHNINTSIIEEPLDSSIFGIVVHTDKAIFKKNCDIYEQYSDILNTREAIHNTKKSFLKKLFG